jgi:biopolymer transport protein ExbD
MVKRTLYQRYEQNDVSPRITLTSLIDTALVLLVIFMVATPLLDKQIKVDLPSGHAPDERKSTPVQPITITIDRHGIIYYAGRIVTLSELRTIIEKAIVHDGIKGVIVAADQQVAYGIPFSVVDMLKATGLEFISFSERPAGRQPS